MISLIWVQQDFELELRREYTEHFLCKQVFDYFFDNISSIYISEMTLDSVQIKIMKDVESLKDVTARFGSVIGNHWNVHTISNILFRFVFDSIRTLHDSICHSLYQ